MQSVELAKRDKPDIERVEPLRNEVARCHRNTLAGTEEDSQEVGHR